MAKERLRTQGEVMAHHLHWLLAGLPFTGRIVPVATLNPYRERSGASAELLRIRDAMARIQWQVLTGEYRGAN